MTCQRNIVGLTRAQHRMFRSNVKELPVPSIAIHSIAKERYLGDHVRVSACFALGPSIERTQTASRGSSDAIQR